MYNKLDQTHWITKQGEKLDPLTDMTIEHITNVMNILVKRAERSEGRLAGLKSVLPESLYNSLRGSTSMESATKEELQDTPLFKRLMWGLERAIKENRFESKVKKDIPYEDADRILDDIHAIVHHY
jgi:hypothetical protein